MPQTFNQIIRKLSTAPAMTKPSQMPVLKTAYGMTVEAIEFNVHWRGLALVRVRGISVPRVLDLDSLRLVPRAELLAGQVLFPEAAATPVVA